MHLTVLAIAALLLAFPEPVFVWAERPVDIGLIAAASVIVPALVAMRWCRKALRTFNTDPADPSHGQAVFGRGLGVANALIAIGQLLLLSGTRWLALCEAGVVTAIATAKARGPEWLANWLPTITAAPSPVGIPRVPVIPELLAVGPLLLACMFVWIAFYPADRAVRQIALEIYLTRGRPIRPVWGVLRYLSFNLRHQVLFILAPMLLVLAARDVIDLYRPELLALIDYDYLPDLLLGGATILVAIIAPSILRRIWMTQRLPRGPLRDRLSTLCRTLRLRCREILVWRSGGMLVNAAVMGVVAPFRYVLITDGMLEQLDDRRIEAVFGHEAGHAKRHHILFFLLFALISGSLVTVVSVRMGRMDTLTYQLTSVAIGLGLLAKWGLIFGWVSRQFERQADMFGVRTLAMMGLPCSQPCAIHEAAGAPAAPDSAAVNTRRGSKRDVGTAYGSSCTVSPHVPARPSRPGFFMGHAPRSQSSSAARPDEHAGPNQLRPAASAFQQPLPAFSAGLVSMPSGREMLSTRAALCMTAAELFGDTLYQVAILNGIPPEARSWRHGSIASRARILRRMAAEPQLAVGFERRVRVLKVVVLLAAAGSSLWAAAEMRIWEGIRAALG